MEIKQSFTVARDMTQVWKLFQDVPAVVACMPGAELLADKGNGLYSGRVGIKLGPFSASFEGDAQLTTNSGERSGHLDGKGVDRRGGSRSKLVLDYRLSPAGEGTRVDIDADIQLSGPVAQFGRTGIINETANVLMRDFAQNVEAKLAALPGTTVSETAAVTPASGAKNQISVLALLGAVIASFLNRLFRRDDGAKE